METVQHVIFIPVEGKLETWGPVFEQKSICPRSCVFIGHGHMSSLVALVLRMALYGAYGAVKMQLKDACMPQGIVDGPPNDTSISSNEVVVPLGSLATRYHGNGVACIKILLPMGKVQHQAQVVPCEDAREAGAQLCCVGILYVLVRPFMYTKLLLAIIIAEDWAQRGADLRQQYGRGKAFGEDRVATGDDGVANNA